MRLIFDLLCCIILIYLVPGEAEPDVAVTIETSSRLVVEGTTFSVCVKALSSLDNFAVNVEPELQFITADRGDLSPVDNITPVKLTNERPFGCSDFQALRNDDSDRFSETLAVGLKQSDSFVLASNPSKIYITIVEIALLSSVSFPSSIVVSEGNPAVVCFRLSAPQPIVLNLGVRDITTDAADYSRTAVSDSVVLSASEPVKCLRIPTYRNNDSRLESFQITLLKSLDKYSKVMLPLGVAIVNIYEDCRDGEIRLGNNTGEGIVEICRNGQFEALCGRDWTTENSNVVCKQAGYYMKQNAKYRLEATQRNVSEKFRCQGNEDSLFSCPRVMLLEPTSCPVVYVQCVPDCQIPAACSVPCKIDELECPVDGRCLEQKYICDGLADCVTNFNEILDEQKCSAPGCPAGTVNMPLIGGTSDHHGLAEVCVGGDYYPISTSSFTVDEAAVVCRSAGLGEAGYPLSAVYDFGLNLNDFFRQSMNYLAQLRCNGTEISLSQCQLKTVTFDRSVADMAAVQCVDTSSCINCSNGDIRLVPSEGLSRTRGRVEVFYRGVWGVIFDPNWTVLDASVVCKQLGHNPKGALAFIQATFPGDDKFLPVLYDSPSCEDPALYSSILECPRSGMFCNGTEVNGVSSNRTGSGGLGVQGNMAAGVLGQLTHVGRRDGVGFAGVNCEEYSSGGCTDLAVRLSYRTDNNTSGNLEICFMNVWRAVCLEHFTPADLIVACRSLGFQDKEEYSMSVSLLNDSSVPFGRNLSCTGSESSFTECTGSDVSLQVCSSVRIQCAVSPNLYIIPRPVNGHLKLREGERAKVQCVAEKPESNSSSDSELIFTNDMSGTGINIAPLCLSTTLFDTSGARLNDSGTYTCEAVIGALNKTVRMQVMIEVERASGELVNYFLRFSTLNSQQRNLLFNDNSSSQLENIILDSLSSTFPGVQSVRCYDVERRAADLSRRLARMECVIQELNTSAANGTSTSSPVGQAPSTSPLEHTTIVLETFYPTLLLFLTSSNVGFCSFDQTIFMGVTYQWEESQCGTLISQACPDSRTGVSITRMCGTSKEWEEPDTSACTDANEILRNALDKMVNEDTVKIVTESVNVALAVTAANKSQQTSTVLQDVAIFFDNVLEFSRNLSVTNDTIPPVVVSGLVQSISSLQQWRAPTINTEPQLGNRIIQSFQDVASGFAASLPESASFQAIVPDQVVFEAQNIPVSEATASGTTFAIFNQKNSTYITNNSEPLADGFVGSVFLPPDVFQDITSRSSVGVVFSVFIENTLFPLRESKREAVYNSSKRTIVASPIVSSSVGTGSIHGLESPVEIKVTIFDNGVFRVNGSEKCVFWDFQAANGSGNWSTTGCTVQTSSNGTVTCHCDHLTNFAVLVDVCTRLEDCDDTISPILEKSLTFITYLGVALSMAGVIVTIITLSVFKKLRDHQASKFHIQLSAAIFMMLLVFVVGVQQASDVYVPCVLVSVLIHYFTLASVLWMGGEASLMFRKFIFVFKPVTSTFIVVTSLICWLAPLIFVLVPLILDLTETFAEDLVIRRNEFCFLSETLVFFLSFLAPILTVILFNIVLFIVVVVVLVRHFRGSSLRKKADKKNRTSSLRLLISIFGIMSLFGLSWIFAAFTITIEEIRLPAQILFTVFSSFQGFGIFIFFCVLSREARESWKEVLSCGKYKSAVLHPSKFAMRSVDHRAQAFGASSSGTIVSKASRTLKSNNTLNRLANGSNNGKSLTMTTTLGSCDSDTTVPSTRLDCSSTSTESPLILTPTDKLPSPENSEPTPTKVGSDLFECDSLPESKTQSEEAIKTSSVDKDRVLKPTITRTTTARDLHEVEEARLYFADDDDNNSSNELVPLD